MRPPDPPASTAGRQGSIWDAPPGMIAAVRESILDLTLLARGHDLSPLLAERRRRLEALLISPPDAVIAYKVYWEYLAVADKINGAPDASPRGLAELLLSACTFGDCPASPIREEGFLEAGRLLERERKHRELLERVNVTNAADLGRRDFPPIRWAVPGIVAEGLCLLAAPPKSGKSFLSLQLLRSVAAGSLALGRVAVERGRALYVSLEDSPRRLQTRLERQGGAFPPLLDLVTDLQGVALADYCEAYCSLNLNVRMIACDTLGRALKGDLNDYNDVTALLAPMQRLALEYHVGILLVHHTRKGGADSGEDPFESSLGSTGIMGACDGALILERRRGEDQAVLHVVGRDLEDASHALELERATMTWRLTNASTAEIRSGPERRKLLSILKSAPGPMRTGEIANKLGRSPSTVSEHLRAMLEAGIVTRPGTGLWAYAGKPTENAESTENEDPPRQGEAPLLSELSALSVPPAAAVTWEVLLEQGEEAADAPTA